MSDSNNYKADHMMHSIKNMNEDTCNDDYKVDEEMIQKSMKKPKVDYKKENKCMNESSNYMNKSQKASMDLCMDKPLNQCANQSNDKTEAKNIDKCKEKPEMMQWMEAGNTPPRKDQYPKGLCIGDKLPKMKVVTTMGERNLPDDYLGKWLILFSHPGDFTPVCTTEFVSFAKNYNNFNQLDTELLALSIGQLQPHMEWTKWMEQNLCAQIPFPIIADAMGEVASKLGMMNKMHATKTVRGVFIIDPQGTIRMILNYPEEVGRNMEEIIRALAALQISDKHKVAMPANWPNNELIGDQVILPPPNNMKDMNKNKEKYCGYNWWFCYKELE